MRALLEKISQSLSAKKCRTFLVSQTRPRALGMSDPVAVAWISRHCFRCHSVHCCFPLCCCPRYCCPRCCCPRCCCPRCCCLGCNFLVGGGGGGGGGGGVGGVGGG